MKSDFSVTRSYMGYYKISIRIGRAFEAKNLNEVNIAIKHYFDNICFRTRSRKNCPLCREK